MIVNIWSQFGKIATHIATLGLSFPVYAGRPVTNIDTKYSYFQLVSNSERVWDDWIGTRIKRWVIEFVFINAKDTPDYQLYEMLDEFSNKFCIFVPWARLDLPDFRIIWIVEWQQSGVLRDTNWLPFISAEYYVNYNYINS
jgi:hypothetical protein